MQTNLPHFKNLVAYIVLFTYFRGKSPAYIQDMFEKLCVAEDKDAWRRVLNISQKKRIKNYLRDWQLETNEIFSDKYQP